MVDFHVYFHSNKLNSVHGTTNLKFCSLYDWDNQKATKQSIATAIELSIRIE